MMHKSALVAGGTGLVGNHLVNLLTESNEYEDVKVLVRTGSRSTNDKASVLEVDYRYLPDFKDQLTAENIFCCLGTTIRQAGSKDNFYQVDFTFPFELAKISLENGSRQFNIVTSSGASASSMFFYNRVKGEIENALKQLEFKSLNIFRPSLLLGERDEMRFGEEIGSVVTKMLNPVLVGKLKKYRAIEAETVAKAMLNVSLKELTGVQIVESDMIQEYGDQI